MKSAERRKHKLTLSDKITDFLTVKPRPDIEDDEVFNTKPKTLTVAEKSSSDSEEATISDFRKRNVSLLSQINKKYEGEVVSRNKSQNLSTDESDSASKSPCRILNRNTKQDDLFETDYCDPTKNSDYSTTYDDKTLSDSEGAGSSESDDYSITRVNSVKDRKYSDTESSGSQDVDDNSDLGEHSEEAFEHLKQQDVSAEINKGSCVRNQLLIWEGLLEMRINLQRCLNVANKMPLPDTFQVLKELKNTEFVLQNNIAKENISTLLNKLVELQNQLFSNYPETKTLNNPSIVAEKADQQNHEKEEDSENEEIPSDTDDETIENDVKNKVPKTSTLQNKKRKFEDFEKDIAKSHKSFKSFRDSTIQKWHDKTRLANATNLKNAPTNTILQQIAFLLSDKTKLVRRTQLKRSEFEIIGYNKVSVGEQSKEEDINENSINNNRKNDNEYIPEIFDDSDFYHQLLRELIEYKSADISDPVQLSRQWIALQQMRSKMKRKVDTKATKGRRIKYVVHNKLVNFMAPEKNTKWTDESKNELYSSLFGKMFQNNDLQTNGENIK